MRAGFPYPSTPIEREAFRAVVAEERPSRMPPPGPLPLDSIDEILLLMAWFRAHPDALRRTTPLRRLDPPRRCNPRGHFRIVRAQPITSLTSYTSILSDAAILASYLPPCPVVRVRRAADTTGSRRFTMIQIALAGAITGLCVAAPLQAQRARNRHSASLPMPAT